MLEELSECETLGKAFRAAVYASAAPRRAGGEGGLRGEWDRVSRTVCLETVCFCPNNRL